MNEPQADILVVDDQPVNIRLLATMLTQMGYKVRKATSGEMALTAIRAILPDLVLLDITMPQMDGYEVCRMIKSDPYTSDIPVIFVSALDESMDKTKAFEVGAIDYVAKPFQWAEVQARVKTQLALRQLQQQSVGAQFATPPQTDEGSEATLFCPEPLPETMSIGLAIPSVTTASDLGGFADWFFANPATLHLGLAEMTFAAAKSPLTLATVQGLFRGLSIDPVLTARMQRAQRFLTSDTSHAAHSLGWVQAELDLGDRTLHYGLVGYGLLHLHRGDRPTLQVIAPDTTPVISTLSLDSADVVVLFSAALHPKEFPSANTPLELTQSLQGAVSATEILERLWPYFNPSAKAMSAGSLLVLTDRR